MINTYGMDFKDLFGLGKGFVKMGGSGFVKIREDV